MIKCLCCGKEILNSSSEIEVNTQWHQKCVQKFFGTKKIPEIDISDEILESIVEENTKNGFTVPGVQKKLSLHLTKEKKGERPRLTLVNYPTGYILKPQVSEYEYLPEVEYLVMTMAKAVGISTVPFAMIKQGNTLAYITRRIDRVTNGNHIDLVAMEDFCQLDGRLTQDKYRGSYERCNKIVSEYSVRKGIDLTELFIRIVFSFVVGNSDMHLKNFSLIETGVNTHQYVLSAAYDMLPVNIILPDDKEQLALTLNGKKRNITRNDFLTFADNCNINRKVALNLIKKITDRKDVLLALCDESYLPDIMKNQIITLINERIKIFDI